MIAIKNDCTLKSPVFCVPRVFHPRHSAIYQASAAYGAALMGDSCSLIKTPRMAFAIRGRFLPLAFSSALSAWFLLPQIPPICTDFSLRSVGLRRVSCSLIKASRMANSTFRIISLLHII